jgi:hypothetical protein
MTPLTILRRAALSAAVILSLLPALPAQEEDENQAELQELIRQIRRNMIEVERDIDRAQGDLAKAAAKEAKENLDKIIADMKARGEQISKDIEEFIKKLPP